MPRKPPHKQHDCQHHAAEEHGYVHGITNGHNPAARRTFLSIGSVVRAHVRSAAHRACFAADFAEASHAINDIKLEASELGDYAARLTVALRYDGSGYPYQS
jgi:hypothetical protein